MNKIDYLIGRNDIYDIIITKRKSDENLVNMNIKFVWKEDCGCFSINRTSCLSLNFDYKFLDKILDYIKNCKGIIGAYIVNHQEYIGKLLEIKESDLVD